MTAAAVLEQTYRVGVLTPDGDAELVITDSSGLDALRAASSTPDVLRVDTISAACDRR